MIRIQSLMKSVRQLLLTGFIGLSVMSCGGSSVGASAGISGTGIVFGVITGFGSIIVNGVRYDIDSADFNVDGNTSADAEDDLKIGMVVKLDASNNGDGTGEATSVVYDELVEGPVENVLEIDIETKSFEVFGTKVIIHATSTVYEGGASFNNLVADNVVEVSGFIDSNDQIIATLVERKFDTAQGNEVDLHGQVQNLMMSSFQINGVIVNFDVNTEFEDLTSANLANNLFVEVEGVYDTGAIIAEKIEGEDDDRDEIEQSEGEVSVQGIITEIPNILDKSNFSINGIAVEVDTTQVPVSILNQLELGLEIEVEGEISNGIIMADEIQIRKDERKYAAVFDSVNGSFLRISYPGIGTIDLLVDNESQLEDEINGGDLLLSSLNPGVDEVEIEASVSGSDIRVKSLKLDNIESYEISGVVEAFVLNTSITIDGLEFSTLGADLEPDDLYSRLQTGISVVEMEGDKQDLIMDEVELE